MTFLAIYDQNIWLNPFFASGLWLSDYSFTSVEVARLIEFIRRLGYCRMKYLKFIYVKTKVCRFAGYAT